MFIVVVCGATAVGKSAAAMALAARFDVTIVNADAMQLYQGMDIGTAKTGAADRQLVPHVGLDLWGVSQPASVAEYRDHARGEISRIWDSGRLPVVVGGSQLYLRALCDELDIPPTDPLVRAKYEGELNRVGANRLHEQLAAVAPEAAENIQPGNGRRIVRALEVVELTGSFTSKMPPPVPWAPTLWLGLVMEREQLDERIEIRVQKMWDLGLVDEVRRLKDQGLESGRTAGKAVGYRQVLDFLDGTLTAEQTKAAIVAATRKLARRQQRAFRANTRINWSDATDPNLLEEWATAISEFATGESAPESGESGESAWSQSSNL